MKYHYDILLSFFLVSITYFVQAARLNGAVVPPIEDEKDSYLEPDIDKIMFDDIFEVQLIPKTAGGVSPEREDHDYTDKDIKKLTKKHLGLHDMERKRITNAPKRRAKRFVRAGSLVWDNGIVPYVLDKDNVPWQPAIYRAMGSYSRFSCLRFVPWSCCEGPNKNVTTNSRLGLHHQGHIIFRDYGNCVATQGNTRNKNGQDISCCDGMACLHEMGHALGAYHENQNPLSAPLMRVNFANIQSKYKFSYDMAYAFSVGYDIQSVMHYGYNTWSSGGHTMSYLASWIKTAGSSGSVDYYYLMMEISLTHKCHSNNCSSVNITCENDGYLTMVDGRCQCRCPQGLNPVTNCATVLGSELAKCKNNQTDVYCASKVAMGWCTTNESVMKENCARACGLCNSWMKYRPWPKGQYALPKVKTGCPTGFPEWKNGSVTHSVATATCENLSQYCYGWKRDGQCTKMRQYMNDHCSLACNTCWSHNTYSYPYDLAGSISNSSYEQHFCVNTDTSHHWSYSMSKGEYDKYEWPHGAYCVYRYGGQCPKDFIEGTIKVNGTETASENFHADFLFAGKTTTIILCCRDDGYHRDPIPLPSLEPFALIKYGASCQEVEGMAPYLGYAVIYVQNPDDNLNGYWPLRTFSSRRSQYMLEHCVYYPRNLCGGVHELSADNPTIKVSSPAEKLNRTQCNWLFKGPPGTRLVLNFPKFHVPEEDGSCVDKVRLRFNRIGSMALDYCGNSFDRSISTISNNLMVTLETWSPGQSEIEMEVKLMYEDNLCYNSSDKGATYNGKHNYTIGLKKCIPWNEAKKCVYNLFTETDHYLEGNYCRNPGGNGISPWCYTDADSCERDYCDVCQFEKLHDNDNDCNKSRCGETLSGDLGNCALTCKDHLPTLPTPNLAKDTKCGAPPTVRDSDLHGPAKTSYHVGESVIYKCKVDNMMNRTIQCLSTGVWSQLTYVCETCPSGWERFQNRCYKYMDEKLKRDESVDLCKQSKAHITFAQSPEENTFVSNFRSYRKEEIWLGGNDEEEEKNWIWDDGTPMSWTNWDSGQPNNYGNEDSMTMLWDGYWRDTKGRHYVICALDAFKPFTLADGSEICDDYIPNSVCAEILAADNTTCTSSHDKSTFMNTRCKKSCGKCS